MTANESGSAGFTLIEMLVALSLLSLLSLLMIATVPQLRAFQRLATANDAQIELDTVAEFIARQLVAARRLPLITSGGEKAVFVGTPSSVSFVGVARTGSDQFGLRDITIDKIDGRLTLSEKARRVFEPRVHSYSLTDGDLDVTFLYCALDESSAVQCLDHWRSRNLPRYIRLRLGQVDIPNVRREEFIVLDNATR